MLLPRTAAAGLILAFACTSSIRGEDVQPTANAQTSGTTHLGGETSGDASDAGGTTDKFDLGHPDIAAPGDDCASIVETVDAEQLPADIVVVVDNSYSMLDEALAVQANLNEFSQVIVDSGIDARVVLVSAYSINEYTIGVCIEPPLGSGGCPLVDSNPPAFTHVDHLVDSQTALWDVLQTHPLWSSVMRPEATQHLLIVTDDGSIMPAENFDAQFRELDPSYADYKLHGIVPLTPCPEAETVGVPFVELATLTGGVATDLCEQDFDPIFDALTTAVVDGTPVSCEHDIPELPNGWSLDPAKVNVEIEEQGAKIVIGAVVDAAACNDVADGWYFDDPESPTQVILCPHSCERLRIVDAQEASIDIRFGCNTIPAG